jgi:sugar phosphate isomerase/epimerase
VAQLALSSWAVHAWIGQNFEYLPGRPQPTGNLDRVLQLPKRARDFGASALEVCDLHMIPGRDEIEKLRMSASEAGISLFQLLIDHGDITHPTESEINLAYIENWISVAAWGGFSRVRVIAGRQPASNQTIALSIQGLCRLKDLGAELGVGVSTENWLELMATPAIVAEVLERAGIGLVFDFGNWNGPGKYDRLGQIARFATSAHAKCDFDDGKPCIEDFETCLRIARDAGFDGNLTLVHPEQPDEWSALEPQKAAVQRVFKV